MAGNAVYVVLLRVLADKTGRNLVKQVIAWAVAAAAKFVALYLIVVKIICGVLSENLLAAGTLKAPMLKALPATFSWPQLFTALIASGAALTALTAGARHIADSVKRIMDETPDAETAEATE